LLLIVPCKTRIVIISVQDRGNGANMKCGCGVVSCCSGERVALRLREAARDADPHQHGGHAREDARAPLRALPPPSPAADGLHRRRPGQQAGITTIHYHSLPFHSY
jgi:hypothetical protein